MNAKRRANELACLLVVALVLPSWRAQEGTTSEEGPRLSRQDDSESSNCILRVNGEVRWQTVLPRLDRCDYDARGILAGVGRASISYDWHSVPALTFLVVNSHGEIVVLEAYKPVENLWPHGTTYPILYGVHVFPEVAVFRLWPGPGLLEQWWLHEAETGTKLAPIIPAQVIEHATNATNVCIVDVQAIREASLFVVLAATSGELIRRKATRNFGGTICALVDLDGIVTWTRRSQFGSYFTKSLSVESLDASAYRVGIETRASQSVRRNELTIRAGDQGVWTTDDSKWD